MNPVRIRLSRKKGWTLRDASMATNGLPAISVARPRLLGNPFIVGVDGDRAECVQLYEMMLAGYICLTKSPSVKAQQAAIDAVVQRLPDLRGKNLACWCALDGKPCHADVLLELANANERDAENGH